MAQGNLGYRERRKRFIMGAVGLVLGIGLLAFSEMKSAYSWTFLFVLWVAGLGIFQAREKT
jgi:uncharacterized membrane protein HdeD (DUF308 family)